MKKKEDVDSVPMGFAGPKPEDRDEFGQRLREAREYLGFSQAEVAQYLGLQRTALSNIERGQRGVEALELKKLATLYKQPVSYFTGESAETSGLPKDVEHLARAAAGLSESDRAELCRFADYLKTRARAEGSGNG